jgi:hypothetical protein
MALAVRAKNRIDTINHLLWPGHLEWQTIKQVHKL